MNVGNRKKVRENRKQWGIEEILNHESGHESGGVATFQEAGSLFPNSKFEIELRCVTHLARGTCERGQRGRGSRASESGTDIVLEPSCEYASSATSMLVDTPQIVWHGGEAGKNAPVLSLDAHPLPVRQTREDARVGVSFVLATAGTDAEVRLWTVTQPTEDEEGSWDQPGVSGQLQSFVASLEGHQRGVNVVRFSPDGQSLASASDGGTVVIWSVGEVAAWSTLKSDRETQKVILRGATEDIYDLTWSPDSKYIACGSIDRRAHVWEVATKRSIATLEDHANYVQVRPISFISCFGGLKTSHASSNKGHSSRCPNFAHRMHLSVGKLYLWGITYLSFLACLIRTGVEDTHQKLPEVACLSLKRRLLRSSTQTAPAF